MSEQGMPNTTKAKQTYLQAITRGAKASLSSTASMPTSQTPEEEDTGDTLSMTKLVSELAKQRASLREDMTTLIQDSVKPLQVSVDALRTTVNSFQHRLVSAETLAGENFERVNATETTIKSLQATNAALVDKIEDLENRSRRVNLRIINIPEGSENGQDPIKFIAELLVEVMGSEVFEKPPELERAHRSLFPKPREGAPPRPFVVCFNRFQEKERALRWSRQHELRYRGRIIRCYPDLSAALSKKRAAFNDVKSALYRKGIQFRLLHPARLRVIFQNETHEFRTPEEAKEFYDRRIEPTAQEG